MPNLSKEQIERVQRLYRVMPGAQMPSTDDGYYQWGDVEGNDHWHFCETVVRMMDEAAGRAVNGLASAHNLI